MKTYEEMSQDALQRIENYKTEQKKRRKAIKKIAIPALSLCLAAILGFGVWQAGLFTAKAPLSDSGNTDLDGSCYLSDNTAPNNFSEAAEQDSAQTNNENDIIIINRLSNNPIAVNNNIALFSDDFVRMGKDELNEYYGMNVFPDVPDDLICRDEADNFAGYGIYKRNGGTGDVYYDTVVLNYSNADFTRYVNIEIAKDAIPLQGFVVANTDYQKSVIAGQDVIIGLDTVLNIYFIGFMHNNVGFAISADGLAQDEVIAVIRSIVQ